MTEVKICGVTRTGDAELAAELGAWAVGLIFHEPSPRSVEPAVAEEIGQVLHRQTEIVGVFVNEPLDRVVQLADRCTLSMVQLHGDEGLSFCREVARRTGAKVMKAARVKDAASLQALRAFTTDLHLLDSHHRDKFGGTGETFDWKLAARHPRGVPLVLSGGLTPENVVEAIEVVHPFAVDTASGTEASPGVKDPEQLQAFFAAVASTEPEPVEPEPEAEPEPEPVADP